MLRKSFSTATIIILKKLKKQSYIKIPWRNDVFKFQLHIHMFSNIVLVCSETIKSRFIDGNENLKLNNYRRNFSFYICKFFSF